MVKKKAFINKREATHFQVVHRSQRDPEYYNDEATPYVLKPMVPSKNMLKGNHDLIPNPYEVHKDLKDVMEPMHGIHAPDESDYESDWGSDSDSKFLSDHEEEEYQRLQSDADGEETET
jgi:protein LTV1